MYYNQHLDKIRQINEKVIIFRKKEYKKEKRKKIALIQCTQCKRMMKESLGLIQLENNKKNAPICIPCITGVSRTKNDYRINKKTL